MGVYMPPIRGILPFYQLGFFMDFDGFSLKNPRNLGFTMTTNPNQSYHAFGTLMMDGHVWWFGDWIDFLGFMSPNPN